MFARFSLDHFSTGAKDPMRLRLTGLFAALAVLLLTLPALAAKNAPGTNSATFSVHDPTTIGTTQLKPGEYSLQAVDGQNELEILQRGKVVGKAPCHWITLPAKAEQSEVLADQGKVTQVNFKGNAQAVQLD
jgi:hypothetical protein